MAIARVQSKSGTSSAASVAVVFTSAPTQNNLLVATVYSSETKTATAISGWSTAIQQDDTSLHSASIFYKVAGAGESSTVTATSTASGSMHMVIIEYSGCDVSTPLDKVVSATSAGNVNSLASGSTATTTVANEVLVAMGGIAGTASTPTYSNSFTNILNTSRNQTGELIVSATGTYSTTIGYTGTAALMNVVLASFKAATVVAATPHNLTMLGVGS